MIEVERSRNGSPVFRRNGKLLSSAIDPNREAEAWLERQKPLLVGFNRFIILGLGSAYHIEAFAKAYPQSEFLIIDGDRELRDKCLGLHPLLKASQIVVPLNPENIWREPELSGWSRSVFRVLQYSASVQSNVPFFASVREALIARTPNSIGQLLTIREDLSCVFADKDWSSEDSLLSIKHLASSLKKTPSCEWDPAARIILLLEELIK